MDLVTFGCGRLRPRGGDRRCSTAWLLRAAEMRRKTSGSDACGGARSADPGGGGGGEEPFGIGSALGGLATGWVLSGASMELSLAVGAGENGSEPPLPIVQVPHT